MLSEAPKSVALGDSSHRQPTRAVSSQVADLGFELKSGRVESSGLSLGSAKLGIIPDFFFLLQGRGAVPGTKVC